MSLDLDLLSSAVLLTDDKALLFVCTWRLADICVALLLEEGDGEDREQFAADSVGTVKAKNSLRDRRRRWRETCSWRWGWRWEVGP